VRYRILAFDYDGTLATAGAVPDTTTAALERAAASGRRLVLVTGRLVGDLRGTFDRLDLFELVVAENGGVLYRPEGRDVVPLAEPPPDALVERLRAAGAEPLATGEVVVATRVPYDAAALAAIRDLGLEWQVVFNKGAVMLLPPGVSKASGLEAALRELRMSRHAVLGVGDAENDHAFLELCECSVAVANAVPALRERCDVVTAGEAGAGVEELVDRLLEADPAHGSADGSAPVDPDLGEGPARHRVLVGHRLTAAGDGDGEVRLRPHGVRVLVTGPSGSGKSTAAAAVVERLTEAGYRICLVDPEGDYESGIGTSSVVVGDADVAPSAREVLDVLDRAGTSVVVNLLALTIPDRPPFFEDLAGQLAAYSTRSGLPDWLVVDEAHHLLPRARDSAAVGLLPQFGSVMLVTVHADAVEPGVLRRLTTVVAVGGAPRDLLAPVAAAAGTEPPDVPAEDLEPGRLAIWQVDRGTVDLVELEPPKAERQRHRRKYALGTMLPEKSFWFRGPDGRLNLRAHNVALFLQIADGVDDATFEHHLRQGDYARWIARDVGDDELAAEVAEVESDDDVASARRRLREAVLARYTQAAAPETYGRADTG
jgi:hydroxymethylpyrimidine pyrophosphatase-like HAD family hydrolase